MPLAFFAPATDWKAYEAPFSWQTVQSLPSVSTFWVCLSCRNTAGGISSGLSRATVWIRMTSGRRISPIAGDESNKEASPHNTITTITTGTIRRSRFRPFSMWQSFGAVFRRSEGSPPKHFAFEIGTTSKAAPPTYRKNAVFSASFPHLGAGLRFRGRQSVCPCFNGKTLYVLKH